MTTPPLNQQVRTIVDDFLTMRRNDEQTRRDLIALGIPAVSDIVQASAFLATCLMSHDMGVLDEWLDYFTTRMEAHRDATIH